MIRCDPVDPPPADDYRGVLLAVLSAGATVVVTALAEWAVDELRQKYGSSKPGPGPEKTSP